MRANASTSSSPTPVPASIRISSSTSSAVVRRHAPIPPLQPRIRMRIRPPVLSWLPGLQRPPGLCHHAVHPIMTNPALNFLALALYVAVGALLAQRLARGQDGAARGARLGGLAPRGGAGGVD